MKQVIVHIGCNGELAGILFVKNIFKLFSRAGMKRKTYKTDQDRQGYLLTNTTKQTIDISEKNKKRGQMLEKL